MPGGDCIRLQGLVDDARRLQASVIVSGEVLGEKRCSGILISIDLVERDSGNVTGSIGRVEWMNRRQAIGMAVSHCSFPKTEQAEGIEALETRSKSPRGLTEPTAVIRD